MNEFAACPGGLSAPQQRNDLRQSEGPIECRARCDDGLRHMLLFEPEHQIGRREAGRLECPRAMGRDVETGFRRVLRELGQNGGAAEVEHPE